MKLNLKAGTAKLTATLHAAGRLVLKGTGVKKVTKQVKRAGKVVLTIEATGKAVKALKESGKAKLAVKVTFTPSGGDPRTKTVHLALKLAS